MKLENLSQKLSSYNNKIKHLLEDITPINSTNIYIKELMPKFFNRNDDPLEILILEVALRSILLLQRSVKTIYDSITLIVSVPLSLINTIFSKQISPSFSSTLKKVGSQVRFLSAELFEIIGIVVCRSLIFLSIFALSKLQEKITDCIETVQIQIEKTAEIISGERAFVNLYNETLSEITEKQKLLEQVKYLSSIDNPEDNNQWKNELADLSILLIDFKTALSKRRIIRNYDSENMQTKRMMTEKLNNLANIISGPLTATVIPKERLRLSLLKRLSPNLADTDTERFQCSEDLSLDNKLNIFKELQSEIKKTITYLQQQIDPTSNLKEEIDSLQKQIYEYIDSAKLDLIKKLKAHQIQGNLAINITKHLTHFNSVLKKLNEIKQIYSFENAIESLESGTNIETVIANIANHLSSEIREKIERCRTTLNLTNLAWHSNFFSLTDSIHPERARIILGIEKDTDAKKAYYSLSKIHHPDKGGDRDNFEIIKKAYDSIIFHNNPSSVL